MTSMKFHESVMSSSRPSPKAWYLHRHLHAKEGYNQARYLHPNVFGRRLDFRIQLKVSASMLPQRTTLWVCCGYVLEFTFQASLVTGHDNVANLSRADDTASLSFKQINIKSL